MTEPLRPEDPRTLGRFTLLRRLGEGGQGIVYLGSDPQSGQAVAVKVLKAADAEARERLEREMNAVQRVRLQYCIARVIDYSFEGTRPFVVSEFVDGPSLFDRVAAQGPLRGGDLERLMAFTAQALVTVHGSGVVHRDLKPANVLLGPDGPRVVDFGIARPVDQHTLSGQIVGTPAYISPEQLQGQPASRASDVWAWACTMVFAATGYPPFGPFDDDGNNIAVLLGRIMNAEPRLGHGLEAFEPLLRRCLDKNPANRPNARSLRDELEADLEHDTPHEGPPTPPPFPSSTPSPTPAFTPSWPRTDATVDRPPAYPPTPPVPYPHPHPHEGAMPTAPTTPPPFPAHPPQDGGRPARRRWPLVTAVLLVLLGAGGWFGFQALQKEGLVPGGGGNGVPEAFAGTWSGGLQTTGGDFYDVKLVLFENATSGDVEFRGDELCVGELGVKAFRDGLLELELTDEDDDCPNGTLQLSREGEDLSLVYAPPGEAGGTTRLSKGEAG